MSVSWVRSRFQLLQTYLNTPRHYKWTNKAEFILSCVGYCIGFGNIWRFPYVLYRNGGGAFFIPYIFSMIVLSIPMFYLECLLGQFTGCNAIAVFNFAPVCKGIGFAMTLVPIYVCTYYTVFMAYSLMFIFASFSHGMPWDVCDKSWGADSKCYDQKSNDANTTNMIKEIPHCSKWENKSRKPILNVDCHDKEPSSEQKAILHLEDASGKKYSLEDIGVVQWDLLLALMVCWLIHYIVISRGIRSIAKVHNAVQVEDIDDS